MKKILIILCSFMLLLEASNPTALFETTKGNIQIELRPDLAPKAVENFVTHAKNGYYNGLIFHRVIKNFMIQGGDPTGTGAGGESIWNKSFDDEFAPNAVFDKAGILAMANKGPNTNGSQFFITTVPTYWLNGRHTIFGYVTEGFDIVKKIESVETNGKYRGDKPLEDIKIISISIKE
ncbi:peptidylprolyl isomerase [Arcobacter aquimarinus]|uniref:Peptidyl-prolyl cis-trans isomerase n=1 Tax=Arcobacter aquimarinus TaxID=1315211 RepID=A0AAE7B3N7_9BACT|nr:peptidylprolyl isomerase [Arcobacter aquimarinus]MCB9096953.1 peptidylprolyl isomerase [Arcobacter sp.]QKE25262.1 peptidyl-prolyl cis-trans isomerase B (WD40 domain-containing) [Arcobacter aquimarinus]RXI36674.1 peptidylprolyl isomerase [Arcobacter aquimarinus]